MGLQKKRTEENLSFPTNFKSSLDFVC